MRLSTFTDRLWSKLAQRHASRIYRRFQSATLRTAEIQSEVLLAKVRQHAGSDFGRVHGFDKIRSVDEFRRQVPIHSYEDLRPYIERVKFGETRALFSPDTSVRMFALTSGTTEEPKYVPITDEFMREYRRGWNAFGIKAVMDHPEALLRSIVQVVSPMDESRTAAGIPCGSISGLLAQNQMRLVRKYYVVPPCVARIEDAAARYYTIMRLAAVRDVAWMVTASPATQLKLAKTLVENSEQMIRDVRDGTLDSRLPISSSVRNELRRRLKADVDCSRRLTRGAESDGVLLPKHCWRLSFLANWTGGTMGLYLREFPKYFGDVPVRDIGLLASEGRMSIPISDDTSAGILDITSHFFEFMPVEALESNKPSTILAQDLIEGREYSVVLTTSAGFYRYDMGDVVRMVGFEHSTPIIEFLHRGRHVSSMSGEKLTEQQAVLAFQEVRREFDWEADLFVLAPRWSDPPYYCLHVEDMPNHRYRGEELAERLDASLGRISIEYASKRKSRRLGGVRINFVPEGFLAQRDQQAAARARPANEQFKHTYLLTQPDTDLDWPITAGSSGPHRVTV